METYPRIMQDSALDISITPLDPALLAAAQAHLDGLTKPRGSLGHLEQLAARYVAITGDARPVPTARRRVCLFAGDHRVTEEGVSAYPPAVTELMVRNILAGGAAINALTRAAGAELEVTDAGMAADPGALPGLRRRNVKRGADNIAHGPAMSLAECKAAIGVGLEAAGRAASDGVRLLGSGEMGIGNTTPASALQAHYLSADPALLVGAGTGLDAAGMTRKTETIRSALEVNAAAAAQGPLAALAALGGVEIAAICGLCLGGAAHRLAVLVDGFISCAGALAAMRIAPAVGDYLFFAHLSAERGATRLFEAEGLRPILDLDMRLGEGSGAALAMPIIAAGVAVYNEMATFADAGIAQGA